VPTGFPNPVPGGGAALKRARPLVVHTKVAIVDDSWAMIQSGKCARRSLFSDFEHGVAFIDPSGTSVRDLRASLRAEAFNGSLTSDFNDIDIALNGWNSNWGTSGGITIPQRTPTGIVPQVLEPVDLVAASQFQMTQKDKQQYDNYSDFDARQSWGFFIDPLD
jgi:phosphatidylserine/phosphatidylglycerophosphate/cardiolipin synthase-like enzyme